MAPKPIGELLARLTVEEPREMDTVLEVNIFNSVHVKLKLAVLNDPVLKPKFPLLPILKALPKLQPQPKPLTVILEPKITPLVFIVFPVVDPDNVIAPVYVLVSPVAGSVTLP